MATARPDPNSNAKPDLDPNPKVSYDEFERFVVDRTSSTEAARRLIMLHVETADNIAMKTELHAHRLEDALSQARRYWSELDPKDTGVLQGPQMDQILAFTIGMIAAPDTDMSAVQADTAMAKAFVTESMTWPEFETLVTTLVKRHADFEVYYYPLP